MVGHVLESVAMRKPKPIGHSDRETLVRRRLRDVMGHATSKPAYGRIHNDAARRATGAT